MVRLSHRLSTRPSFINRKTRPISPVTDCALLEPRLLLHAGTGLEDGLPPVNPGLIQFDSVYVPVTPDAAGATATTSGTTATGSAPLSAVPVLNSLPSAHAQLYLDFVGDSATTWGSYSVPATPAYDQDGDTSTFSDAELASIQQIWARVSEKYSPFNINVTTVNPGSFADHVALKVVIGGNGAWTGGTYGGISYVGSFYNGSPNTAYVFTANLGNGNAKYTAEAASHEAGHGFGLQHQSSYDSSGTKTAEYYGGNSLVAPVMGVSYYSARGLWWYGTSSVSSTSMQDDMAILSGSSDGFGYRPDDHGNSISTADSLQISGTSVSGLGVIEKMSDSDWFSFTAGAGTVSFSGNVVSAGATLDLKLALYTSTGTLITLADTSSLGETLSANLAAGSYRLVIASHGGYGDVGQYTLSGSIVAPTDYVAAPTSLSATVISASEIDLAWTDQSSNETGFTIQRSSDGGATWVDLATTGANVTSYADMTATAGTTYDYRVSAHTATVTSDDSNIVSATTIPAAPASLTATVLSANQVSLQWADVLGETGYRIERSSDGVSGWSLIGSTGADNTSFLDGGLQPGVTWYYRVFAVGSAGLSDASNTASATTPSLSIPAAPSDLIATAIRRNKIQLTWTDNASIETGYIVQRSTNGQSWSTIATLAADSTSYTNSGLKRGSYYYRVAAFNSAGTSDFSNVDSASLSSGHSQGAHAPAAGTFSTQPIGKGHRDELF